MVDSEESETIRRGRRPVPTSRRRFRRVGDESEDKTASQSHNRSCRETGDDVATWVARQAGSEELPQGDNSEQTLLATKREGCVTRGKLSVPLKRGA